MPFEIYGYTFRSRPNAGPAGRGNVNFIFVTSRSMRHRTVRAILALASALAAGIAVGGRIGGPAGGRTAP